MLAARLAVIKNSIICTSLKKRHVIRQMSSSAIRQQVRHIPWQTYNALISYAHKCLANRVPAQNVFLGDKIFRPQASNSSLFGTPPLKAQNDQVC